MKHIICATPASGARNEPRLAAGHNYSSDERILTDLSFKSYPSEIARTCIGRCIFLRCTSVSSVLRSHERSRESVFRDAIMRKEILPTSLRSGRPFGGKSEKLHLKSLLS